MEIRLDASNFHRVPRTLPTDHTSKERNAKFMGKIYIITWKFITLILYTKIYLNLIFKTIKLQNHNN